MKTKKAKEFDCVEMKRRGAEAVMKRLKGLSMNQQLAYWQGRHQRLVKLQAQLSQSGKPSPKQAAK